MRLQLVQLSSMISVIFLSDGTATESKEMHDATLMNIAFGFGKVISCAELIENLK